MKKTNDQTIKDVLKAYVNESAKFKRKYNQARIQTLWMEMMGPTINKYTGAIKVRDKTLFIDITSAPLREELSYGLEKIKKLFNEKLGEDYIEKVVIR